MHGNNDDTNDERKATVIRFFLYSAYLRRSVKAWPVTTPGCTDGGSFGYSKMAQLRIHKVTSTDAAAASTCTKVNEDRKAPKNSASGEHQRTPAPIEDANAHRTYVKGRKVRKC